MEKFSYRAKDQLGRLVAGVVEVKDQKQAVKLLHEKKLTIINLNLKSKRFSLLSLPFLINNVSPKDVCQLTRQLSTMIGAGLTLNSALSIIQEQAKPVVGKLLGAIIRKVEGGATFSEALNEFPRVFSRAYISLVKSGESSGKLDTILNELAASLEQQEDFKRKIKGALIYPAIISIGMIVVSLIMMIYVIPKLTEMYKDIGAKLPLPTLILIGVSQAVARFWYLFIITVAGLLFLFFRWRKTSRGRLLTDKIILKTPIAGKLVAKIVLTQISSTLSMLITAGVPIIEALNIVSEVASSAVFENSILKATKDVEKGLALADALAKFDEYPAFLIQMISVGEQTGKVGEILARVAHSLQVEAEEAIRALTTSIEPLIMVILGIGVGFIVISIITPIYNLTSQF